LKFHLLIILLVLPAVAMGGDSNMSSSIERLPEYRSDISGSNRLVWIINNVYGLNQTL
jgi:hypothetical protein